MPLIVISGGGTGGHIYPAIGLAQAIAKLDPEIEICFIGGADRLESTLVPQHGFRFSADFRSRLSTTANMEMAYR